MPREKGTNTSPASAHPDLQQGFCIPFAKARLLTRKSQVRCDAASLGVPCTNCVAFQIECRIPTPKRKKAQTGQSKDSDRYGSC